MGDSISDLLSRIERLESELGRLKAIATTLSAGGASQVTPTLSSRIGAEPASRRDLLRFGAVALGAAAGAATMASPAEAADGGPLLIGADNTGTQATYLTTTSTAYGFYLIASAASYGVVAVAAGNALYGYSSSLTSGTAAVLGFSVASPSQAPGVHGVATSPTAPGIYGRHDFGGNAVRAEVPASTGASAIALYALNYSTFTGGGPGAGGFAIYGISAKGHGLVGATAAAGAAAVVGASNGVPGAYAAAFYGPVTAIGDLTVVGGAKSAAVPHPDGSHRRLYCVESPESWFEDFGRGRLACGEATVVLDPDFAAVVETSDYHVFLTGEDGAYDLCVSNRTARGFNVKARSADAAGDFSWRLVAKRRDIPGHRLERVDIPKEPTLPDVPASVFEPPPSPPDLSGTRAPRRQNRN